MNSGFSTPDLASAPLVNPCAELPMLLSEALIEQACEAVTGSDFAVELVTGFSLAMTLALVEAGFPQLGNTCGLTVMDSDRHGALICGQQLSDPHSGTVLTLATTLGVDKSPGAFGAMHVRWDILRELQKNRPTAAPGRKLVTKMAFEVPAIAPQALTGDASQLLNHLKKHRRTMVAKVVRNRAEAAARELVEALAP